MAVASAVRVGAVSGRATVQRPFSSTRAATLRAPFAQRSLRLRAAAPEAHVTLDGKVTMIESREDFEQAMAESNGLVVLDISSTMCGPCKLVYPYFVELAEEFSDATFLKVNGDTNSETVSMMKEWGVKSVPEFRMFRGAEMVHKHSGANKDTLRSSIEENY
mmetsp:Transcript_24889/g.64084  ORF Transcript_24889/g.64084 Transcript_24889/m.64084 type:complete len:162 (-) Transcript_24889:158-643(-)